MRSGIPIKFCNVFNAMKIHLTQDSSTQEFQGILADFMVYNLFCKRSISWNEQRNTNSIEKVYRVNKAMKILTQITQFPGRCRRSKIL